VLVDMFSAIVFYLLCCGLPIGLLADGIARETG